MNIIELSYLTMFYACERFNCHKCLPCRGVWRIRRKFRIYENWMEFSSYPDPPHALLAYFCFLSLPSFITTGLSRALSVPLSPSLYTFPLLYILLLSFTLPPLLTFFPQSPPSFLIRFISPPLLPILLSSALTFTNFSNHFQLVYHVLSWHERNLCHS